MKRIISMVVVGTFFISLLTGCVTTSETGNKTAAGAGLGAIAGGIIGFLDSGNYLVMSDGSTRTPDTIRTRPRNVQNPVVVAKQTVAFNELLPGKYTHVAIVKVGNKTERSEQTIEVAAMKGDSRQYASKGTMK